MWPFDLFTCKKPHGETPETTTIISTRRPTQEDKLGLFSLWVASFRYDELTHAFVLVPTKECPEGTWLEFERKTSV